MGCILCLSAVQDSAFRLAHLTSYVLLEQLDSLKQSFLEDFTENRSWHAANRRTSLSSTYEMGSDLRTMKRLVVYMDFSQTLGRLSKVNVDVA